MHQQLAAAKAASNVYCPSTQGNLSRRRTRLYRPANEIRTRASRSVRCDRATRQPQVMIQNPVLRVSSVPITNKVRNDVFEHCSLESRDGIGCQLHEGGEEQLSPYPFRTCPFIKNIQIIQKYGIIFYKNKFSLHGQKRQKYVCVKHRVTVRCESTGKRTQALHCVALYYHYSLGCC